MVVCQVKVWLAFLPFLAEGCLLCAGMLLGPG